VGTFIRSQRSAYIYSISFALYDHTYSIFFALYDVIFILLFFPYYIVETFLVIGRALKVGRSIYRRMFNYVVMRSAALAIPIITDASMESNDIVR
jgi:hypothetical protein